MSPTTVLRVVIACVLTAATGCAAGDDGASADSDLASTARTGYFALASTHGVFQSLAVVGDVAFVGDNDRTIAVVDLATRTKTGSIAGRIVDDTLTPMGAKVVACGLRDDSPITPFGDSPADRSYVLTVIDAATQKVDGEIELGIEAFLATNPRHGLVDLPRLSCRYDADARTMAVTFSQKELGQERLVFPMPPLGSSMDFHAIPGMSRMTLAANGDDTLDAAATSPYGITYAAGGYGLRRLAPNATRATPLRREGREQLVDLAIRDGKIFAVDNGGGLIVADDATGRTRERVEIPDLLEAVALTPGHVVVAGRAGLFITSDRW